MKKPLPKEVFDNPEKYINFLTLSSDNDFECQYFDRKEAGRLDTNGNICSKDVKNLKENFVTCISAFANSNKQGGLLVVGIDSNGKIIGINHLSEEQINCLCNYNDQLVNQAIQNKPCYLGNKKEIILIYVPYSDSICETISKNPRSWQRLGKQNIEMTQEQKEILKRDKQIVSYEKNFCCKFDPEDLDKDMIEEFKKNYLIESDYYENYTVKDILNQIGAIKKNPNNNDTYYFTNAGFLFFASNPRREIPYSYIRLLRFKSDLSQDKSSISTLDKDFSGPIVKQIQKIRIYLNESGFFDIYQKRSPDGGFIEEPEFPVIAIDEAIVNSVAHRDYAIQKPIECYKFNDTFIVINPGRILQNEQDIPFSFSLDKINLNHNPRNSYIIDWLRKMKDSEGRGFIRALSEGTRRMVDEMKKLNLPAPKYDITPAQTKVSLYNNYVNRIKDIQEDSNQKATEYTNLYPLEFYKGNNLLSVNEIEYSNTELLKELSNKLNLNKWYIDKLSKNILVAFRTEDKYKFNKNIDTIIGFYPAFSFSLKKIWQNHCLCIDYNLKIKNRLNISILLNIISSSEFIDKSAIVHWGEWIKGKIKSINENNSIVLLYDNDEEVEVPNNKIIPNLPILMIERILKLKKVNFDLYTIRKKFSLSLDTNASFKRADMTQNIVNYISSHNIFPISLNEIIVDLIKTPVTLNRQNIRNGQLMVKNLKEPKVEFNSGNQTEDIREGITKFGSRDVEPKDIEIVPFCMENYRDKMSNLINNIKNGQYKYRGSERNFFTKIFYNSIISINSTKNILTKCQYIIKNNPNWINNPQLNRLFLVHTPDNEYALDDEHSPYFKIKKYLLEQGIPCQMVDNETLINPKFKDLNLALNIISKCGKTPWVLPDAIPDADFIIGLSYTSRLQGQNRIMGFANVFNQYGRWQFYSGGSKIFSFDDRIKYFQELVANTLTQLNLSDTPSIYFHYTKRFSADERKVILQSARKIRPNGIYNFVSINTTHNIRLYDKRPESNGSLRRGSYVAISPRKVLISTTGYNPYKKIIGTPIVLEITIDIELPEGKEYYNPDLKSLATQILSLTKLNWASTESICGEPITIKYAKDIARFMEVFSRLDEPIEINPILTKTPWFI